MAGPYVGLLQCSTRPVEKLKLLERGCAAALAQAAPLAVASPGTRWRAVRGFVVAVASSRPASQTLRALGVLSGDLCCWL